MLFPAAPGGKTHSKVTPATESPRPNAYRISVADGKNEQICIKTLAHEFKTKLARCCIHNQQSALYSAILYVGQTRDRTQAPVAAQTQGELTASSRNPIAVAARLGSAT